MGCEEVCGWDSCLRRGWRTVSHPHRLRGVEPRKAVRVDLVHIHRISTAIGSVSRARPEVARRPGASEPWCTPAVARMSSPCHPGYERAIEPAPEQPTKLGPSWPRGSRGLTT